MEYELLLLCSCRICEQKFDFVRRNRKILRKKSSGLAGPGIVLKRRDADQTPFAAAQMHGNKSSEEQDERLPSVITGAVLKKLLPNVQNLRRASVAFKRGSRECEE